MSSRQVRRQMSREYELLAGHDPYPCPYLTYTRHIDVLREQCQDGTPATRTELAHG